MLWLARAPRFISPSTPIPRIEAQRPAHGGIPRQFLEGDCALSQDKPYPRETRSHLCPGITQVDGLAEALFSAGIQSEIRPRRGAEPEGTRVIGVELWAGTTMIITGLP